MTEWFSLLLDWVAAHPTLSGIAIFLVAMSESLAVIGMVVPGVAMMFGIGALIAAGSIGFLPAMLWAVAGAVAGDGLSFWFGHHFRHRLELFWPFRNHPQSLQRGISFFQRYGGKSVFIGRFFGPVRAIIPLIAGMMSMSPARFVAANIFSALLWAPAYLLPGMIFGASLELASQVALRLVILLLLLLALLWLVVVTTRTLVRLLQPHASQLVRWLLGLAGRKSWLGEMAAAIADPNHPEARGLSLLALLLILSSLLFGLITGHVLQGYQGLDIRMLQTLQSLRTPWGDQLMTWFTLLADYRVMLVLTAGVMLYLFLSGHRRSLLYWLSAAGFAFLVSPALKLLLQLPRPQVVSLPPESFSFPSGHTLKATVIYGFLAVMIARPLPRNWRWLPYGSAALLISAVGLSRLYLGVHWLSDVMASLTLGLAWVSLLGIAYGRHTRLEGHWLRLTLWVVLLVSVGLLWNADRQQRLLTRYQPLQSIGVLPADDWWRGSALPLPLTRQDLRGGSGARLNIQYLGRPEALADWLTRKGWRRPDVPRWSDLLRLISPGLPMSQMPLLPQVHDSRHEQFALLKMMDENRRLVLRLWQAPLQGAAGEARLWLGSVSRQRRDSLLGLLVFARTEPDQQQPLNRLLADLAGGPLEVSQDEALLLLRLRLPSAGPDREKPPGDPAPAPP